MDPCDETYIVKEKAYFKKLLENFVSQALSSISGPRQATKALVVQHSDDLFSTFCLCARMAAHKFDPMYMGVGAVENRCKNWLQTICKRVVLTWQREQIRSQKHVALVEDVVSSENNNGRDAGDILDSLLAKSGRLDTSNDPAQLAQLDFTMAQISRVCKSLSTRRQEMLQMWLTYFDDSAISDAFQCSECVVRAERSRTLKQIRISVALLERRIDLSNIPGLSDERLLLLKTATEFEFSPKMIAQKLGLPTIEVVERLPSAITRLGNLIGGWPEFGGSENE